ncbi:hypothetical protein [Synechococcus sp. 1G10]|uniref:hypothetical protein n=1 Tax=Synechococcus sp. 1G10 TaxID=2025605 RepID=UPI00117C373D|nr:hypothetical protein [Synechococcus sp. 1G10]
MSRVLLSDAIKGGNWYHCVAASYQEEISFRLRVLGFSRSSIDELQQIPKSDYNKEMIKLDGIPWVMYIEIVSLVKKPIDPESFRKALRLIDSDGFSFKPVSSGLDNYSPFEEFYSRDLAPKMKRRGAILMDLPDEEAAYAIGIVNDGLIEET